MDDDAILGLYLARSEEAIAETAGKYGSYCQAVARRILAQPQDCEECVNDAYHRVWNAIPPQKPQHLRAFLARIVRNLALDRIRHDGAQKRGSLQVPLVLEELEACVPAAASAEEAAEGRLLAERLDRFLGTLPREARIVFLRRYWYFCPVAEIARDLGLSESKVKMLLLRTREKLRHDLEKEGLFP